VEDSPNGLKSAYSAGCIVVYIPDLTQPDRDTDTVSHLVFNNMFEMLEHMERTLSDL
jgi:beta-phosphoglucomutase-like phosphatase (HAD superfamily)